MCEVRVHSGRQIAGGFASPDVYFRAGYGQAAGIADGGEWILLEAFDGAWQVPLILRTLADGTRDAISPTFSGAYAAPSLSSTRMQEAWLASVGCLRELGIVSVVLRGSPLVPQASGLPGLRSIVRRKTIVLESVDTQSAWNGMESRCRRATRKALKNGYTGDVRPAVLQDLTSSGDFRRLYEQTMQRVHAAPLYFFSDSYYRALLDGLGPDLLLCEVRNSKGAVASSDLLMRHGQRLHPHLGGSNPDDGRMGSNNLVNWTEMQFAIDDGLSQFHIGAGLGGVDDSLFNFKRSFGGRQLEFEVSGQIIDDKGYQMQVDKRAKVCDISTDSLVGLKFFPAYRAGNRA